MPPRTNWLWAELMQRSFGFDRGPQRADFARWGGGVLACPRCGDRLELIALIEDPKVIGRILRHLGVPTEVPTARPARPPPLPLGRSEPWYDADAYWPPDSARAPGGCDARTNAAFRRSVLTEGPSDALV